jgi:GTPase
VVSSVRKISYHNVPFLLSDTVGFIRKLPHHLIESFKSTLDEAHEADILLHVVDASHPHHDRHMEVVRQTLQDLKMSDQLIITVFNKMDRLAPEQREALHAAWQHRRDTPALFISAQHREGIDLFRDTLLEYVVQCYRSKYPNHAEAALRTWELVQRSIQEMED